MRAKIKRDKGPSAYSRLTNPHTADMAIAAESRARQESRQKKYELQTSDWMTDLKTGTLRIMYGIYERMDKTDTPGVVHLDENNSVKRIENASPNQQALENYMAGIIAYQRKHYPLVFPTPDQ